jgi:hypothetical protein
MCPIGKHDGTLREKGGMTMTKLQILGLTALALLMLASDAWARGAVSGGMRGAAVGGMMGGSAGAATGAKIGVVAGATQGAAQRSQDRNNMDAETQARAQYYTTPAYQNAQYSNFNEAPPEVMVTSPAAVPVTTSGEAVIRIAGKPVVGITYPSDWKQKASENRVTAVSADGHAWSVLAILQGVKDKQAAISQTKQQLEKYLKDIDYDDPTETTRGALMITGSGKSIKSGVEVVFAAGVFDSGAGPLAGAAFVVDKGLEDNYKATVKYTCETIRGAKDFTGQKQEVAKPVVGNK